MDYIYVNGELYHHGVLGQKWGVRRFQNADGSLTAAGKERYRTDKVGSNIGRALVYTSAGQKLAVSLNKGYKADVKNIKTKAAQERQKIESKYSDKNERKEKLKSLKDDVKKTKFEARMSAANAIYGYQSDAVNRKIQSESFAKSYVKSLLMGGNGYGNLKYNQFVASGHSRFESAAVGFIAGLGTQLTLGIPAYIDYAYHKKAEK